MEKKWKRKEEGLVGKKERERKKEVKEERKMEKEKQKTKKEGSEWFKKK